MPLHTKLPADLKEVDVIVSQQSSYSSSKTMSVLTEHR